MTACVNSACAAEIPDGTRFCSACGTPQVEASPICGHEIAPGMEFCPTCGTAQRVELGSGLPLHTALEWSQAFATLGWCEHLEEGPNTPKRMRLSSPGWGIPDWQWEWLTRTQLPLPQSEPTEPWVFCTRLDHTEKHTFPHSAALWPIGAEKGQGLSAGYLVATRCRFILFFRSNSPKAEFQFLAESKPTVVKTSAGRGQPYWEIPFADVKALDAHKHNKRLNILLTQHERDPALSAGLGRVSRWVSGKNASDAIGLMEGGGGMALVMSKPPSAGVLDFLGMAGAIASTDGATKLMAMQAADRKAAEAKGYQQYVQLILKFFAEVAAAA